jgi:hypothetical protein
MKKIIIFTLFLIGISAASFAQEAGKEQVAPKKEGFFHKLFHRDNKPRAQMHHFESAKRDPNLKHNGTAFWNRRRNKNKNKVDGDGFSTPSKK